jgi:hypothetical protein
MFIKGLPIGARWRRCKGPFAWSTAVAGCGIGKGPSKESGAPLWQGTRAVSAALSWNMSGRVAIERMPALGSSKRRPQ